jgi:predicted Zn-dependent protease
MIQRVLSLVASAVLVIVLVCLPGCETNAATGRSQLLSMSPQEEIKLGTEAQPELTQEFGGATPSPELQSYVTDIGRRLSQVTEADNPRLPWEFTLLDSKVINAFALPGGKVFFSRGLAEEMTNEAQMAAVLGHECGHVTARHTNERFSQQIITTVGGAVIGGLIGGAASGKGEGAAVGAAAGASVGGIVALSYSRDQEIEADRLGMRYMERLRYDPVGAIEVQQILKKHGGGGSFDILATHPSSDTRISELNKRYQKYYQHTAGNKDYSKFEDRFKAQFLDKIKKLPPPKHTAMTTDQLERLAANPRLSAFVDLSDPTTWCAHCRAAMAETTADERSASVTVTAPGR